MQQLTNRNRTQRVLALLIAAICVGVPISLAAAFPKRLPLGYIDIASFLTRTFPADDVILICSDANGEGALIEEIVFADVRRPSRAVVRGTKLLSDNRWSETTYRPRFKNFTELSDYLEGSPIHTIVVDQSAVVWPKDRDLLMAAVSQPTSIWKLVYATNPSAYRRNIVVFRRTDTRRGGNTIEVPLPYTLGRGLTLESPSDH